MDVSIGIADVRLAIVNVVLVHRLFGLHHGARVELNIIEEDGPPAKRIVIDSCGRGTAKAWVETPLERPITICLLLEGEWNIVITAANVGTLTDEVAREDGVTVVDDSFRGWFCLA